MLGLTTVPAMGTSAAAPLWAALVACLGEALGANVGHLQPLLYPAAAASASPLHDVTEGSNDTGTAEGDQYEAKPGLGPVHRPRHPAGKSTPQGVEGLMAVAPLHGAEATRDPAPLDVLLVSMPFGPVSQPSLGLSLLRGTLRGPTCEIYYGTFELAEELGSLATYRFIAEGNPNTTSLVGEWIMAPALFPGAAEEDPAVYLSEVLTAEATVPLPAGFVDDVLSLRRRAAGFVNDCVDHILARRPAVVGFTSVFQQHVANLAAARLLKERSPDTPVIVGGANCEDVMGEETLRRFPFIDALVSGEGEEVFPRLVDRALARQELAGLPGVLTPADVERDDFPGSRRAPAPASLDASADTRLRRLPGTLEGQSGDSRRAAGAALRDLARLLVG